MADQMFTICRFTKACVHTFLHLDRFQDVFSSRSYRQGKKKGEGCRGAFSLGAYRRAPSQDAFPFVPFPLSSWRKEKGEFSLFSLNDAYIYRLQGNFLSTYSWWAWKSSDKARLSLFLSLFSSYLRAGYFFVSRFYVALCGINLTCACFCCFSGYSVNLCSDWNPAHIHEPWLWKVIEKKIEYKDARGVKRFSRNITVEVF